MQKARSRLQTTSATLSPSFEVPAAGIKPARTSTRVHVSSPLLTLYLKHLPTLILGLISAWSMSYVLTRIHPDQIKDIILPQSYLPLLLTFFLTCFFIFSFILLNSRRGTLLSLFLTVLLFLQLQRVIITIPLFIGLTLFFLFVTVLIELGMYFSRKK